MAYVLRMVGLASGEPSRFDGEYVKFWDVNYIPADTGEFDGGMLITTPDINEAKRYPNLDAALAAYRAVAPKPWERRGDGEYNRPLTAWHMEFETV